ncbi:MAG: glutaminase [Bacteroidetes bacterium]|nr:MAG: glutaminase [Bacteroidota bacterium]
MDYQEILDRIYEEVRQESNKGIIADYIPALAEVDPNKFGIAVHTVDGKDYNVGDASEKFSIQSIAKLFTLTMAIKKYDEAVWDRVGKEPSGTAFNSLIQLEYEMGIPRNPFINAGALVVTDIITNGVGKAKKSVIEFMRKISNNNNIAYDFEVADSERNTGYKNVALANLIKSFGNLNNKPEDVLSVYYHQSSIHMSCIDLSRSTIFLANKGFSPYCNEQVIGPRQTKRVNSVMLTSGMYDAVGDFAYRVGLPGKSGVGGGIIAVIPGKLSISVWAPGLNSSGNSTLGLRALELFTTYTGLSVF